MPIGLSGISSFVARDRLSRATSGARAVAGFDEDALTLAAEALLPLAELRLSSAGAISGVTFASSSAPIPGRSCASLLAAACDVPFERARTIDLAGTARAGVAGIIAAFERLTADLFAADLLVAASDAGAPPPASGDAAVAVVVSRKQPIAEILAVHSTAGTLDDAMVPTMRSAIGGALTTAKIEKAEVARWVIGAPTTAGAHAVLEAAGVEAGKLAPLFDAEIGHTGCAQPLLSLAAAMESATPGEVIVLAAWGDGADAIVFRTTGAIASYAPPRRASVQLAAGKGIGDRDANASRATTCGLAHDPESDRNLRLHGARCRHCNRVQAPAQALCVACGKEGTDPIRLSRTGTVVSSTRDSRGVAALVELEGGGRMDLAMTGIGADPVSAGMPVELSLRHDSSTGGSRRYFWKARPVR